MMKANNQYSGPTPLWLRCFAALVFCGTGWLTAVAVPDGRRLKDIVADKYKPGTLYIGAAIAGWHITNRDIDAELLDREFSYVTPENDFKQSVLLPAPNATGKWDTVKLWLNHARETGQTIRAHAPIGPQSSKWVLDDDRTPDELKKMLYDFTEMTYKKLNNEKSIRWIDVVNETVHFDGTWFMPKTGTEKWENPWPILGYDTDENKTPLYIGMAFEQADRYAPNLKHVYNHHGQLEKENIEKVKQTILYLRKKGRRVDGLGWQAHLKKDWDLRDGYLDYLNETIDWAHNHGLEFHITEFNIMTKGADDDKASLARTYGAVMTALLSHRNTGVIGWDCWHIRDYGQSKGNEQGYYSLMFAEDGTPNPAYFAVQKALENPPALYQSAAKE